MSHKFFDFSHLCPLKSIVTGKMFLVLLLALWCGTSFANEQDIKWVRVRIAEKQSRVQISADALTTAKDLNPFQKMSQDFSTVGSVKIESIKNRKPFQIKVADGHKTQLYIESELFLFGKNLKLGATKIPPIIKVKKNQEKMDLIAFVPLEIYLAGVIQGEVPKNWSRETLKAQIVAARTYALNLMENKKDSDFDLESSIKDQVFLYSTDQDILKLAQETKNQVLMDKDKRVIKAYYHSDCGGRTSSVKNVFGYSNESTQVVDPFCQSAGLKPWEREMSYENLKEKIGAFDAIKISHVTNERNFQVTIERDNEDKEILNAQVFRSKLGYQFLKSTWFDIVDTGKSIIFKGKGNGHGVGLCQWGAKVMGDRGYTYKEILKFYYPETKLKEI